MNENVRKVFDMLGLEPNEKFKINTLNGPLDCINYIDENLMGYEIVYDTTNFVEDLVVNILNGSHTIIKLPKKKKLRDLTEEEYLKWKEKNCVVNCDECIFDNVCCTRWVYHKDLYSDKFLDQEIEVNE